MLEDQLQPAPPPLLARRLGVGGVLLLTLSVTTPASSLFVIVPGMLQVAGTGAIWATLLAAIVCIATGFIYAELSSAYPAAGGEYVAVAATLGPLAGFVMLGINVFNNIIFLPVAGLGIREVLAGVIPSLPEAPVAMAVIAGSTLIGLLNIRIGAVLTGAFLLTEIVALFAVTALGLVEVRRDPMDFLLAPVMAQDGALVPTGIGGIGLAAAIAIFAFNGYGAAVYFGEEMQEAPRRIARAIFWALGLTLLLEGLPLLAALMGAVDLPRLLAAPDPFGELTRAVAGERAATLMALAVAIAIVNAIIAWVLACARFFYGTARDGSWGRPLDRWLRAIHPAWNSPWAATLFVGLAGMALCVLPLRLLEILSGTGLVAIYAGLAVAAMVGRRSGATAHARYRMPFYPLAPLVTLAALALIAAATWADAAEGRPALIATVAQMAIAALYYLWRLRRRGWTGTAS